MSDKIFVGKGKEKFDGDVVAINICLTEIPKEHINAFTNKKGETKSYVNLDVKRRKEADDRGNTHYVEVNTWKPDGNKTAAPAPAVTPEAQQEQVAFDAAPNDAVIPPPTAPAEATTATAITSPPPGTPAPAATTEEEEEGDLPF